LRNERIPVVAAVLTLVFHLVGNPHYGFFRDELYFIVCGRHPAWGYVDQPPLTPLAAALTQIFGISLIALRAVPAVLAAAAVYVTCRLARELGGGAFAQILAAIAAVLAPIVAVFGTQVSPDMFELWLWPLATLFALRAIRVDPRWWLGTGALIGVATESKYSAVLFALALIAGMLLAPQRRALWNAWFAAGAAIAILIALSNFVWQAHLGFPMLELLRNGQNGKNVVLTPLAFFGQQVFLLNPVLSIVWMLGLAWSLYCSDLRWLGYTYLCLLLAMIGLHGKNYYLAPVYPVLFALGATAIEAWTIRRLAIRAAAIALAAVAGSIFIPLAMPVLSEPNFIAYNRVLARALRVGVPATEHQKLAALPQDYADMHGWPQLAAAVASVYLSLAPNERSKASIFASNYGEAAAIDFFGRRDGLPPALSGHNQYWLWGPRGYDGSVLIDVNANLADDRKLCRSAKKAATFSAPYVMPYEDEIAIVVCRGLKQPVSALWPRLKHYE